MNNEGSRKMQNIYPLFGKNRVLKQESMRSLRDYSFTHMALEYQEYSPGIIRGCEVEADGKELAVRPGIVKAGGFIFLIAEELRIRYEATEQWQVLKCRLSRNKNSDDCIAYVLELFLDSELERQENELEICRFKLRKGSRLRSSYKDFDDMNTEYDTVNLLHATWSGMGKASLAPSITRYFAERILAEKGSRPEDISFAYFCMGQQGTVPETILKHYIAKRLGGSMMPDITESPGGNQLIYGYLAKILENIRLNREERNVRGSGRHQIIVD